MTKVPVNVPNFATNMMYGAVKVQNTDATGEFGKIFESQKNAAADKPEEMNGAEENLEPQEEVVKETEPKEVTGEVSESQSSDNVKETVDSQETQNDNKEDAASDAFSEEELNLMMPMLQTAVSDIKEMLATELGISQEELSALMEGMGLEDMDLLTEGTLRDIVLQMNHTDRMALLTNEELYGQIQSLEGAFTEVMETVQDTLQMTDEEMNALKEQLTNNVNKEPVVTVETEVVPQTNREEAPSDQNTQNNAFAAPNQEFVNAQNVLQQTQAVQGQAQTQAASFVSAQTENIMNQIMDYMKIQLNMDTSTLEMQLQPENLGTLQIRISAKEGIMTAQFTTASETVKAALESQMVQLQQQFENQNIKVEAIEVTVQTHQFESALEQNGGERQQFEEGKKNRVRTIDLNQLEDVEEIPEEDRLVAEMMAASGSTVDYRA